MTATIWKGPAAVAIVGLSLDMFAREKLLSVRRSLLSNQFVETAFLKKENSVTMVIRQGV